MPVIVTLGVSPINVLPSLSLLVGKTINHAWFGDYSALYIELGELSIGRVRRDGAIGNSLGEISIYAGFGWNLNGPEATFSSHSIGREAYPTLVSYLLHEAITYVGLAGKNTELEIKLSNGYRLVSTSEDALNPEWSVSFNAQKLGHLCITQGRLYVDHRAS